MNILIAYVYNKVCCRIVSFLEASFHQICVINIFASCVGVKSNVSIRGLNYLGFVYIFHEI